MVVADLHVHTTNSDGELPPSAVIEQARSAGLSCVAVTDHDRLASFLDGPVVRADDLTVLSGIELRVETATQRIDLLAYAVRPTPELHTVLDRLQENRIERAREIVERVESHTGVDLAFEPTTGVGRPHIARAIEASPIDLDYSGAFAELIGNDGPCFVPRSVPSFERGLSLLTDASSFVSLAHPFRYQDPESALERAKTLDGIEYWYPYTEPVDQTPVERALERFDLVPTGGSDAHDRTLGVDGLDRAALARFSERAGVVCD